MGKGENLGIWLDWDIWGRRPRAASSATERDCLCWDPDGWWSLTAIPALRKQRQGNHGFSHRLAYTERP